MTPRKNVNSAAVRRRKQACSRTGGTKNSPTAETVEGDLRLLLGALEHFDVEIRTEDCLSEGGLVRMQHKLILFLNPTADPLTRRQVCLNALRHFDTDTFHVPPRLRTLLGEKEWD